MAIEWPGEQNADFTQCRDCNAIWSGHGGNCPICGREGIPEAIGAEHGPKESRDTPDDGNSA